jgi:MarR family transcriptional regulator, organic hydroperoxide resistance regulator
MKLNDERPRLGQLVGRFMGEMHRYDMGRTLRILYAAKLTTPQTAVLELVRTPHTVSAVARHVGLSLPAASQMIAKLADRRLVRRSESAADRRERAIVLSAKGTRLLRGIAEARIARFEASLAVLPPRVATRLQAVLNDVVGALEKS